MYWKTVEDQLGGIFLSVRVTQGMPILIKRDENKNIIEADGILLKMWIEKVLEFNLLSCFWNLGRLCVLEILLDFENSIWLEKRKFIYWNVLVENRKVNNSKCMSKKITKSIILNVPKKNKFGSVWSEIKMQRELKKWNCERCELRKWILRNYRQQILILIENCDFCEIIIQIAKCILIW